MDFTPRFGGECLHYCPVDLNANLYAYEQFLAECSDLLGWNERRLWEERAAIRAERMRQYLWNEERGLFLDYDFVNERHSATASLIAFHPLWVGLATAEEAERTLAQLPRFEREFGLAVCEEIPGDSRYQWGFPNMWPPLVYTTVMGLAHSGYHDVAQRLAAQWLQVNIDLFAETGQLWEKIDVLTGKLPHSEYDAQPMLGWSAGVFIGLAGYLDARTA